MGGRILGIQAGCQVQARGAGDWSGAASGPPSAAMRLVSYGERGLELPAVLLTSGLVPITALGPEWPRTAVGLIASGRLEEAAARATGVATRVDPATVRLGAPVPQAGKIICIGMNYADHAAEQGKEHPLEPLLFCKTGNTLSGPHDPIPHPRAEVFLDYEVELVVCIGKQARDVKKADALDYVAGVMVGNDVSARRWQRGDGQWYRGKSCDGFFPCGPALVTLDELGPLSELHLTTTVNGVVRQDAKASLLIHDIPALIAHISADITLEPGDLISTGTPCGVGAFLKPPVALKAGDEVVCAIAGVGELRNRVVAR